MSKSDYSNSVSTVEYNRNEEKDEQQETVFMNGKFDSIISINKDNLDELRSDGVNVPNDFFTTYLRLILWEQENKMGGIQIDSNLFTISRDCIDADDIAFDHVSPRIFVYCRHCLEYIQETRCYHYFSIIFRKESKEILIVEKTSVNSLQSTKCQKRYSDICRYILRRIKWIELQPPNNVEDYDCEPLPMNYHMNTILREYHDDTELNKSNKHDVSLDEPRMRKKRKTDDHYRLSEYKSNKASKRKMWNLIYLPIIVKNKITSKKVTCGFVPMRVNYFVLENNRDWSGFSSEWKDCEGTKTIIIQSFQDRLCKYLRYAVDNDLYTNEEKQTLQTCLNSFAV